MKEPMFKPFYLVEVASLSWRLEYGESVGIDLFTHTPYGSSDLLMFYLLDRYIVNGFL